MMTLMKRLFAPFAALLALAQPVAAKAPVTARPALWSVSDADTTIYLFGTIHLLPQDYQWRSPGFDQALSSSDELVVETIVDLEHPQAFQASLLKLGYSPGLPPILERVPPAKRALLKGAIAKSGLPESSFNLMETWLAGFMLLGVQLRTMGLEGKAGPEEALKLQFAAAKKPIGELETNAEQLGFFDRLPEKAQRQLLEGAIEAPVDTQKEFRSMLASWSSGDVNAIARSFNRDLAGSPELMNSLIKQRNANWSRWIEQRMAKPGSVFIAVGAGHLAGPSSVIRLLERDGYRVHRLQ
jgi:hypothetical protein